MNWGMKRMKSKQKSVGKGALLLLLLLLLSGCSGWNERPFVAMEELATRMTVVDQILQQQRDLIKSDDLQRIASQPRLLRNLQLEFPDEEEEWGSPYSYRFYGEGAEEEPLFLKIERLRLGLRGLNQGLVGYLNGLSQLASGALIDSSDFAALGHSLNRGMYTLAGISGSHAVTPGQIDLFSTLVGQLGEGYVSNKRRDYLQQVVSENHPELQRIADHVRSGVRLVADQVRADYSLRRREVMQAMSAGGIDRAHVAELMYQLSAHVAATLDLLAEIDNGYSQLARTHAQLGGYLRGAPLSTAPLEASVARLEQLQQQYSYRQKF